MKKDSNSIKNSGTKSQHGSDWNFDQRNESYYLGKINETGESDDNMRYYTDGKTGRYYRKGEIIQQEENPEVKEPFRNNSHEGKRKRNFSFRFSGKRQKD
jgi:hypothetical protein